MENQRWDHRERRRNWLMRRESRRAEWREQRTSPSGDSIVQWGVGRRTLRLRFVKQALDASNPERALAAGENIDDFVDGALRMPMLPRRVSVPGRCAAPLAG